VSFTGDGVKDGDFIVMQETNCNNAHAAVTNSHTLGPSALLTNVYGSQLVLLSSLMTNITRLKMCYAIAESGGDEATDYAELPSPVEYEQLRTPIYTPQRTVTEAPQRILLRDGRAGDQVRWMNAASCVESSTDATATRTIYYTIQSTFHYLDIHAGAVSGSWKMCYIPSDGALTEMDPVNDLVFIPKPIFSPIAAPQATINTITFQGSVIDGDFVTLQKDNCVNAHQKYTFTASINAKQELVSNQMNTSTILTENAPYVVCFASKESEGDSQDDFVTLDVRYALLDFTPRRTVEGAPQSLKVLGGVAGARFLWTQFASCTVLAGSVTPQKTIEYTLTGPDSSHSIIATTLPGTMKMCYNSPAYDSLLGTEYWQIVADRSLTVIASPTFSPTVGYAGSATPVVFGGTAVSGDVAVMQVGNCAGAHTAVNGVATATGLLSTNLDMTTRVDMTSAGNLVVCYATLESGADSQDDFGQFSIQFSQLAPPTFTPLRTIQGASQVVVLSSWSTTAAIAWTQDSTTCGSTSSATITTTNQTQQYSYGQNIVFASDFKSGSWAFCAKPTNGLWSIILNSVLTIFVKPLFQPKVAYAGTTTRITFGGGPGALATQYPAEGDFVVFEQMSVSCALAIFTVTTTSSLAKQSLDATLRMYTDPGMTSGTSLKICYASAESGGDTADDWAELESPFYQVVFSPQRTIARAPQLMTVLGGPAGDRVAWTSELECGTFPSTPTSTKTIAYNITQDPETLTLPESLDPGTFFLCYQQAGTSDFIRVSWAYLFVVDEPIFAPTSGVVGIPTTVTFGGGAAPGDFVHFTTATDCSDAPNSNSIGTTSTSSTLFTLSNPDQQLTTSKNMDLVSSFQICFATAESGGDDVGDYAQMSVRFVHRTGLDFSPMKTVQGAAQLLVVTGSYQGDQVAWTLYPDCSNAYGISNEFRTWPYYLNANSTEVEIPPSSTPGYWIMCFRPDGGSVTHLEGKDLWIIEPPTFSPFIGIAGSVNPITFNYTASPGDFVVIRKDDCLNAHLVTTTAESHGPQNMTNDLQIFTSIAQTFIYTNYKMCFAVAESLGNSADDYVVLDLFYSIVPTTDYQPKRTITGALQHLDATTVTYGYQLYWAKYSSCIERSDQSQNENQTAVYNVTAVQGGPGLETWILHANAAPGVWLFCYKPTGGVWIEVNGGRLTVISQPTFSPLSGISTISTTLTFVGEHLDGDFIVMQQNNCSNAHATVAGDYVLPPTALASDLIFTPTSMIGLADYKLCFATLESGGNTADDYTILPQQWSQYGLANFTPTLTLSGAPTIMTVTNGKVGDWFTWTMADSCHSLGLYGNENQTARYNATQGNTDVVLQKLTTPGVYKFCYKLLTGLWTQIAFFLTILARPTFSPGSGFASVVTSITFDAAVTAKDGDYVVLHEDGCDNAHTRTTTSISLVPTQLSGLIVQTSAAMSGTVPLYVCYALSSTGGDTHDDYATLDRQWGQLQFYPKRTTTGAEQRLDVYGGISGDIIVWTQATNCNDPTGPVTSTKTAEYVITGPVDQFILNATAAPGTWYVCYKAPNMAWNMLGGHSMIIIDRPTFAPVSGFAGSITSIVFTGTAQDTDFVVMQEATCVGAHLALTDKASLARTALSGLIVNTSVVMTAPLDYKMCYATVESGGDSEGDYTMLVATFNAFGFKPQRIVETAPQILSVEGGRPGDKIRFKEGQNCTDDGTGAGPTQTEEFTINSNPDFVQLHTGLQRGTFSMCFFRTSYGEFITIPGVFLEVIALPVTTPLIGVAGAITPITVTGPIVDGDFLVLQENDCSNSHAVVTGPAALSTTPIIDGLISTVPAMDQVSVMVICYAPINTFGDSADDYAPIAQTLTHVKAPYLSPNRYTVGTAQKVFLIDAGGGMVGGTVAFTKYDYCNETFSASATKTVEYLLLSQSQSVLMHPSLEVGTYTMCYKPVGGLWTKNADRIFNIIHKPVFSPLVGIAGSRTQITFNGTIDSDVIVMKQGDCSNAHTVYSHSWGLATTNITGNQIYTTHDMIGVGVLKLCFATQESIASEGNTADDYVELEDEFVQRWAADYNPRRTITGAPQLLAFTITAIGDEAVLTQAADCWNVADDPNAAPSETELYTLTGTSQALELHTTAIAGIYHLCYKPLGGVWTQIHNMELVIISTPTFLPPVAVAGSLTAIDFLNTYDTLVNSSLGDQVVFQASNCNNAHLTTIGTSSLIKTAIAPATVNNVNHTVQITTVLEMTDATFVHVCYATKQAGGDSADDYVSIGTFEQIAPPDFGPKRTVSGAAQLLNVIGLIPADVVAWTQSDHCDQTSGPLTTTKTVEYTLSSSTTAEEVLLHTNTAPGIWYMCYKLTNGGVWTKVTGKYLTIMARPNFSPPLGLANATTPLNFTGTFNTLTNSSDGDFVVLQPNNCDNAHLTQPGVFSFPPTALISQQIITTFDMTAIGVLKVCYASEESAGDSDDDYVALDTDYTQVLAPTFGPVRTIQKAPQKLLTTGGHVGDQVMWMQGVDCNLWQQPLVYGGPNNNQTVIYTFSSANQEFTFHTYADPGIYIMCLKLAGGGVWTTVRGESLLIIPQVTFSPPVGIAGSETPITFFGDFVAGDFIVINEGNCQNSHTVVTSLQSLEQTVINGTYFGANQVVTTLAMDKVTTLKICFATVESKGDSADDYAELDHSTFLQLLAPVFGPTRTVAGAAQLLDVSGILNANDKVVWTQHYDCLSATGTYTNTKTIDYDLVNSSQAVELHESAISGTYIMCYLLSGGHPVTVGPGVWTKLENRFLNLIPRPTFSPKAGVAGSVVEVFFSGTIDGDKVAMQQNNCDNAHLTTTTKYSLGVSVINGTSVKTVDIMSEPLELVVCYATQESFGDTGDDYVPLDIPFLQLEPLNFWPKRFVTETPQFLSVSGGQVGAEVVWTMDNDYPYCHDDGRTDGPATATKSKVYTLNSDVGTVWNIQPPNEWYVNSYRTQLLQYHTHPIPTQGEYRFCFKPVNGTWIWIRNLIPNARILEIITKPIYTPYRHLAGSINRMSFGFDITNNLRYGTVKTGDFVVIQKYDPNAAMCSNAHVTPLSHSSLPVTIVNDSVTIITDPDPGYTQKVIYTHFNLTELTNLIVCYATKESYGESADDYVYVPGTMNLLENFAAPFFEPSRTIASAEQRIIFKNSGPSDQVAWSLNNCYDDVTKHSASPGQSQYNIPTLYQTKVYTRSMIYGEGEDETFVFHREAVHGLWALCFKRALGGTWTPVYETSLTVVEMPTYVPPLGLAGHQTYLTFVGSTDKDFVVMQQAAEPDPCSAAHGALRGAVALGYGTYNGTSGRPQVYQNRIYTVPDMITVMDLVVCYASFESGGDSADDYTVNGLDGYFRQIATPDWTPKRTVLGAKQNLRVTGVAPGDQVAWIREGRAGTTNTSIIGSCTQSYLDMNASEYKTQIYTLTSTAQNFTLIGNQLPGYWSFCYKPSCAGRICASNDTGVWTLITASIGEATFITSKRLQVIELPYFITHVGIAGSVTPITYTGVTENDVIVLRPDNCSSAHLSTTTAASLGVTFINFNFVARTDPGMVNVTELVVCYATAEAAISSGVTADDFTVLNTTFRQILPVSINPDRTIAGAPQKIVITGGENGDLLAFVNTRDCSYANEDDGETGAYLGSPLDAPATQIKTDQYTITGPSTTVALHKDPEPVYGTWYMCYRVVGGLWTRIIPWNQPQGGIVRNLIIIMRPSFAPQTGIAGSATVLTFGNPSPVDYDTVIFQADNCDNAHLVTTTTRSLMPTPIINKQMMTDIRMTKGMDMIICYATVESGADSADDYSRLLSIFIQVAPPDFYPYRTFTGSKQILEVSVPNLGDKVVWIWNSTNCNGLTNSETPEQTAISTLFEYNSKVTLHENLRPGVWSMCHKLATGVWTRVSFTPFDRPAFLYIVAVPTFEPKLGIAASITPITFSEAGHVFPLASNYEDSLASDIPQFQPGDIVVLSNQGCGGAHIVATGGSELSKRPISNYSDILTSLEMDDAASLSVCLASSNSGGDSSDDYVRLATIFVQRLPPIFSPMRTIAGAAQKFELLGNDGNYGNNGNQRSMVQDMVMWSQDPSCIPSTTYNLSATQTVVHELTSESKIDVNEGTTSFPFIKSHWAFTMHTDPPPKSGLWNTCYKLQNGGIWTAVTNLTLTVIARPYISPDVGIFGGTTPLAFHPSASDVALSGMDNSMHNGDFFFFANTDCSELGTVNTGSHGLSVTTVMDNEWGYKRGMTGNTLQVGTFIVCYATKQSLGDSLDDYVQITFTEIEVALNKPTTQSSNFDPTIYQSSQAVDGGDINDGQVGHLTCSWTQAETNPWWRVNLGQSVFVERVVITNRYDSTGSELSGFELRIGSNSSIMSNPKCGHLHSIAIGATTSISCNKRQGSVVSVNIPGDNKVLSICEVAVYTPPQSGTFKQRAPPFFWPVRTVTGAAQKIETTLTELGDEVAWTRRDNCRDDYYLRVLASSQIQVGTVVPYAPVITSMQNGGFDVYTAADNWGTLDYFSIPDATTFLTGWLSYNALRIKENPNNWLPVEAVDGTTFLGLATDSGADASVSQTINSMIAQSVYTLTWYERYRSGHPIPRMTITVNDLVLLEEHDVHSYSVWTKKSVTFVANFSANTFIFRANPPHPGLTAYALVDGVSLTQGFEGLASNQNSTMSYMTQDVVQQNQLHAALFYDNYTFCHRPYGGVWTDLEAFNLQIMAQPSFYPLMGIAGSFTPLTFSPIMGLVRTGDVIVLQPNNCSNAHAAKLGADTLPTTTINDRFVSNFGYMASVATTSPNMTQTVENMVICFATLESQTYAALGNTEDDYSTLPVLFRQREPVNFAPKLVTVEDDHLISTSISEEGDQFFFTQAENCTYFTTYIVRTPIPTMATLTYTPTYVLGGDGWLEGFQETSILANMSIGTYQMCFTPIGGRTTLIETLTGGIYWVVDPKPSDDTLSFNIIKAAKYICHKDIFSAYVQVAVTPEGLISAFDHKVIEFKDQWGSIMTIDHPPMKVTTGSFEYAVPSVLPVGAYEFSVFGIDPLYRANEYDILKKHAFNVTLAPVVPLTLMTIDITAYRQYRTTLQAWVAPSACVAANISVIYKWELREGPGFPDLVAANGLVSNQVSLLIAPYTMEAGKLYTVYLTAYYDYAGFEESSRVTVTTTVNVMFNPLYVDLVPGKKFNIGHMQDITLKAEVTDIDGNENGNRPVTYDWRMGVGSASVNDIMTYVDPPFDGPTLPIAGYHLQANTMYTVNVTISKTNVTSVWKQMFIFVESTEVPLVTVASGHFGLSTQYFDHDRTITLLGTATRAATNYLWTLDVGDFNNAGDILSNVEPQSLHAASDTTNDLTLKRNALPHEVKFDFRLKAQDPITATWGYVVVEVGTTNAPHSGYFAVDGYDVNSPVVTLSTYVTLSASSWKAQAEDSPLEFQFGYQIMYPDDVDRPASAEFILQTFSELISLQTLALPPGYIRPLLWVRNRHGCTRKLHYGCDRYQIGVSATRLACPGAQNIYISNVPKRAGLYSLTLQYDLTKWTYHKYDTMTRINQMGAFMWASHQDYVESSPQAKSYQCSSCIDFQMSLLQRLNHTLSTEDLLGIYSPMVLNIIYPVFRNPTSLKNGTLYAYVNDLLDTALALKKVKGLDESSAQATLNMVNTLVEMQNISAVNALNSSHPDYGSSMATPVLAQRIRELVRGVGFDLLRDKITNSPVIQIVSKTDKGDILIEVGGYRATSAAMHANSISTTQTTLTTPAYGLFPKYNATHPYHEFRQVTFTHFAAWSGNPYSYDSYRTLKSGVTGIAFSTFSDPSSGFTLFEIPSISPPLVIGPRLTFVSGSPACYYRSYGLDQDGWDPSGISALDMQSNAYVFPVNHVVKCATTHLKLTEDIVIADGCFAHQVLTKAESCSSHGFCNQDSTCHCVCGYKTHNCSKVHVAAMQYPAKNRYCEGAPMTLNMTNEPENGYVSLVLQHHKKLSCVGAGANPVNRFAISSQTKNVLWGIDIQRASSLFGGAKMKVQNGSITLPHSPNKPLAPGRYTVCYCNAEKVNDIEYSNCDMDCSYLHRGDTITIIDTPQLGPVHDAGNGRVVGGSPATFRVRAGMVDTTAVVLNDKIFAAKNCSLGYQTGVSTNNATTLLPLLNREMSYLSAFITIPTSLHSDGFLSLKLCFATQEMGDSPLLTDFFELPHTLTVIVKPLFGYTLRMLGGSSPDFFISGAPNTGAWGIEGGDHIYFSRQCGGVVENVHQVFATSIFQTTKYGDASQGYVDCNLDTAEEVPVVLSASSVRGKMPNQAAVEGWCGEVDQGRLRSASAWCSSTIGDPKHFTTPTDTVWWGTNTDEHSAWLQLDTGSTVVLSGILTQGHADEPEWVTQYAVSTSMDGNVWAEYKENGILKVFDANFDHNSIIRNELMEHTEGQFLRIYPKKWDKQISMRAGLLTCLIGVKIQMPSAPALTAAGFATIRELRSCFATRRSEGDGIEDFIQLDDVVNVLPQPTNPLDYINMARGGIFGMSFILKGDSLQAVEGDVFRLTKTTCLGQVTILTSMPFGPSGKITLGPDAVITKAQIMSARLNELNSGQYRICFRTKESLGDSDADYSMLDAIVRISLDYRAPVLKVSPSVNLGQDIVVGWEANNDMDERVSHENDWIGLYRQGDCEQLDYNDDKVKSSVDRSLLVNSDDTKRPNTQNQCFVAIALLTDHHENGEVRFSLAQYKQAGTYEARYFMGDSTSEGGYVCRGLQESGEDTFRQCALEAKATSSIITIHNTFADGSYQHLSAQEHVPQAEEQALPGLETFCVGPECSDV